MVLVYVFEWLAIVVLGTLIFTQVLLPAIRGTPLLPFFRKEQKLGRELEEASERIVEAELTREIEETKKQAEAVGGTKKSAE